MITLSTNQIFKQAWQLTKQHLGFLIALILVIMLVPNIIMGVANTIFQNQMALVILATIAVTVLQILLQIGAMKISFAIIDGQKPTFADVFKQGRYLLPYIGVSLITGVVVAVFAMLIGVAVGTLTRIAPNVVTGIVAVGLAGVLLYVIIRLFFGTYFVVDQGLGSIAAIKQSLAVSKGNVWKIVVVFLALLGINLVGLMLLGLGLLVTIPLTYMVYAVLFRALANQYAPAVIPNNPASSSTATS